MTAPTITPIEAVDLSDLDLLDDEKRHARCPECTPEPPLGVPFIAVCGVRTVWWFYLSALPPNACKNCLATPSCPKCGAGS